MKQKAVEDTKQKKVQKQGPPQPPTVAVTVYSYTGAKPLVVEVPQGTKIKDVLSQAGIKMEANKEVYLNDQLASAETVVEKNAELFYTVRIAGGRRG